MELKIHTRNVDVNPRLQEHVEKKVSKLDRYLPNIQEVRVDLAIERRKQGSDQAIAQLTLRNTRGVILRAEDKRQPDIYAALDVALDKMYRQIERYKGKRKRRGGGRYAEADADLAAVESAPLETPQEEEELKTAIVRRKKIALVPMSEEEAIDQMELLGHSFFIFYNAESAKLGVLYRREDGNYGVLEPDVS
ncbi:MAG: ribosome-associated translation inhibitor RaiA [Chloroflexi bacterium]|nr:ribosome-associated translation inhibitor RaiA [Chloroflexota bacterium]